MIAEELVMTEQVMQLLVVFSGGVATGIVLMLIFNKLRSGSAAPANLKKEMNDYQTQVEAHFEETSEKFKDLANQYQDIYKHLSVGATTLCRPENVAPLLTAGKSPLNDNALPASVDSKTGSGKESAKGGVTKVDAKASDINIPSKDAASAVKAAAKAQPASANKSSAAKATSASAKSK